ncbi:DUF4274 domain-containing protein [Bacillus glycinifermentans]|uniref:DUF4274 domain-containing protein n=1 Tax=Bacillus glycinifermentans TaxID=1664069 RepID=A0ABU6GXN5_9BACI|nr:DUF4274 domain-containing protein [Bacillus glycinifermentans]MEC0483539.1 DUF4274 domain-containing protein [Bacillus glycinifermentans]
MDKKNINFLEELLYNTEKDSTISQVRNIDDPLLLHVFAANYNWNSGFDVQKQFLKMRIVILERDY